MTTTNQQPIDLDAIRARADAATPGPWTATDRYPHLALQCDDLMVSTNLAGNPEADAAFIAHARDDVPALLAEVERLRAELATWRDDVSAEWRDECIRLQGEVERLTREQLNADIAAGTQPEAGAR